MINLENFKPEENWFDMKQTAKLISDANFGRTKLMKFLRNKKVLMANNEPYQKYVNSGYLKMVIKSVYNGHGRIIKYSTVPLSSKKGILFIQKLVKIEGLDREK